MSNQQHSRGRQEGMRGAKSNWENREHAQKKSRGRRSPAKRSPRVISHGRFFRAILALLPLRALLGFALRLFLRLGFRFRLWFALRFLFRRAFLAFSLSVPARTSGERAPLGASASSSSGSSSTMISSTSNYFTGLLLPFFLFFITGQFVVFFVVHFRVKHRSSVGLGVAGRLSPSALINGVLELCQGATVENEEEKSLRAAMQPHRKFCDDQGPERTFNRIRLITEVKPKAGTENSSAESSADLRPRATGPPETDSTAVSPKRSSHIRARSNRASLPPSRDAAPLGSFRACAL